MPLPFGRMAKTKNRFDLLESIGDFPQLPAKKLRFNDTHFPQPFAMQELYMVMRSTEADKKLTNISIFGVQKGLEGITKQIKRVSPQKSGELLILTTSKTAAASLKKAKTLGGLCNIECFEHPFLNHSKAKIYCPALKDLNEVDITEGLREQGVIESRKIKKWEDGVLVNTALLILTFNSPQIPEALKVGYLNIRTQLYIPNPLRCTVCQKFGHGKKKCADFKGIPACNTCAEILSSDDLHQKCNKMPKCVNCGDNHQSYKRECRVYAVEAEIIKIKTVDRVPYRVARQKYVELTRQQFNPISNNDNTTNSIVKNKPVSSVTNKTNEYNKNINNSNTITKNTHKSNMPTINTTKPNTNTHTQDNPLNTCITESKNKQTKNDIIKNAKEIKENKIDSTQTTIKNSQNTNTDTQNPFQQESETNKLSQDLSLLSENERACYNYSNAMQWN